MRGIPATYHLDGQQAVDRGLLTSMTRTLSHRAPDAESHNLNGPVALGRRRLSIIDLPGRGKPVGNKEFARSTF